MRLSLGGVILCIRGITLRRRVPREDELEEFSCKESIGVSPDVSSSHGENVKCALLNTDKNASFSFVSAFSMKEMVVVPFF